MLHPVIKPYQYVYRSQILSVWERSVLASHHFLAAADFAIIKENLSAFDFSLINLHCLVQDGAVLGFIGLNGSKIEMLFLDPAHIGKGFGKLLMDFALQAYNANEVDVNEQNQHALRFYQKFGFETYQRTDFDDFGMAYPLLRMRVGR